MSSGTPEKIGNYKLLEKIGQGGMGTLYRALDPKIGRHVAIKLIREGGDSDEMRERLLREARSAGGLKHANIVTIFELGEHEGQPFIAMEYIQGETLTMFLTHRPASPLQRKLQIIDQLCAGLHYAHRMGVVHRDIKPANIMIDTEGTVKILDFGIARMGTGTTMMGIMIGTLNYMAPEQMEGKSVDARADIFSVGAVIYELFAYRPAFTGSMQSEVMYAILHGRPKPLNEVCPGLDPELISIVDKCLEKKPDDRYQDLAALRQAVNAARQRIERTASTATVLAPMPGVTPRPIPTPAPPPPSSVAPVPPSSRRESSSVNRLRTRADQMRAEQIQAHLERGRRALENGDHDGAFSAAEQVFVLEPQNHEALDLEERTRAAVEQVWLREAQNELARGALTSAWLLTERVLGMNADSPKVESLRQAIETARARQAEVHERSNAVQRLILQAQQDLAAGRLGDATQAIEKVLNIDPGHLEATTLKGTIAAAAFASRRADEELREAERLKAERERLQADAQKQAELRRQQAEAEQQRRVADLPIRPAAPPPPPPAPPPVQAATRVVPIPPVAKTTPLLPGTKPPSRAPKFMLLGGAAVVGIVALVLGIRFATIQNPAPPIEEPPAVSPSTLPPSDSGNVSQPPNRTTNTPQTSSPRAGGNTTPTRLQDPGPPNVIPPEPDAPKAPEPPRGVTPTTVPPDRQPVGPTARDRALAEQYTRAKSTLDSGSFASAATLFENILREQPNYRDAVEQLARAREGVASAVKQAMDAAAKAESAGDLPEALKQLERVAQIDASMAIVAEQAQNRIKGRMKTEGTTAFATAKQYDAVERVDDAIKWYDRAYRFLPDDDPNKKIAKERLDLLRARK